MAPLPEIEGVSRVAFIWSQVNAVNVMHFRQSSVDPEGLFDSIAAHVNAGMWDPLQTAQVVTLLQITPLDGATATALFPVTSAPKWRGSATTGDMVPATAACVSLRTPLRGRSFRGRCFVGPLSELQQQNGLLLTGALDAMATGWGSFINDMDVASSPLVIASYKLEVATPVTNVSVNNVIDTQRRRQSRLNTG